jgi:hypothetical protein
MPSPFTEYFRAATGKPAPHDYQGRFADADRVEGEPPGEPFPCRRRLISIPTSFGKTAAAVGAASTSTQPIFDPLPA